MDKKRNFVQFLCSIIGVCDVLYTMNRSVVESPDEEEDDDEDGDGDDDGNFIVEDGPDPEAHAIQENYGDIIKKVRKIVRFFRLSPKRNDYLQKLIKEVHGVEKFMIADVRTRWSSLFKCLARFFDIRNSIQYILCFFQKGILKCLSLYMNI